MRPQVHIEQAAKAHGVSVVMILDIIHVLEYLWKAAKVRFAPDDPQGASWVAEQIERLLHGQVRSMVRSLRRWATVQGLNPKQREPIDQCATYLANHVSYLNYPVYLAKGYPIATGVIEGACRYLVKDRMAITGARWGLEGGEAVLKLRALVINSDFDAYWTFHETQAYQRNHYPKCEASSYAGGIPVFYICGRSPRMFQPLEVWQRSSSMTQNQGVDTYCPENGQSTAIGTHGQEPRPYIENPETENPGLTNLFNR